MLVVAAQPVKAGNVVHETQSQYLPVFPEDGASTIKALCFVPDPLDPVVIQISLISTAPPGLLEILPLEMAPGNIYQQPE